MKPLGKKEAQYSELPGVFPTTRWSLVLDAGGDSATQATAALEFLCRRYWYPIYAYIRRRGRAHHEAEDCTQEFLLRLLANDSVGRAHRERGRFRAFLVTALRHFLVNEWEKGRAEKRGGGQTLEALDFRHAGERYEKEPVDAGLTPEQAFDRSWAIHLIDDTLEEMRCDYEESGRAALFAELLPLVWGGAPDETLATPAARLGMSAHAFTVALQRLRRRFGDRLRARVAETVASPEEVDLELHHLIAAIRGVQ